MKNIFLVEDNDTIHPDYLLRPLKRSADFSSHSDSWLEISCYGGGPLDHLLWCPVWLKLGKCWWGKKLGDYRAHMENVMRGMDTPYEMISGEIPVSSIISWREIYRERYPLFREELVNKISVIENFTFLFGKYRGRTYKYILEKDPGYLRWALGSIDPKPLYLDYYLCFVFDHGYKPYYVPKYKKFTHNIETLIPLP